MKRYKSEAMQVTYEEAESLYEDGIISLEQLHEFDDCLVSESVISASVAVPQYPVTAGRSI
ncbi:hypothetical protein FACS1894200_10950 [Spirochaetia bacterium]|nr:hypothetical protein FACS1894200_10950 [Spirochaetia bacterium]